MLLSELPNSIRIILLAVAGAMIGAAVNWAIYRWPYFLKRKISPWQKPDPKAKPRKPLDYVPVIGWFGIKRDAELHGKHFWIRPFLIEIAWLIGLPLFYNWQATGGLSAGGMAVAKFPHEVEIWFFAHTIMIALLTVATFIDFDERTIPDGVTVTGLIVALCIAAFAPSYRLPVLVAGVSNHLHFNSPLPISDWHHTWIGLATSLAIFTVWFFAMVPMTFNPKLGFPKFFKIMLASMIRPKRKTTSRFRTVQRKPLTLTKVLTLVWVAGIVGLSLAWTLLPPLNVSSLFCAMLGMATGGGIVWAVRIIGTFVMAKEAMGFGDVTLMFMVGAFLGWQPALLIFVLAPVAGIFVTVAYFIATRESKIAFGPYLACATLLLLLFWPAVWGWAEFRIFGLGGVYLMIVGVVMLVLMAGMLYGLQILKSKLPYDDEEAD